MTTAQQTPTFSSSDPTPTTSQLNVARARVIARTERRGWEKEYTVLEDFYLRLIEEGPHPVYDQMVEERPGVIQGPIFRLVWENNLPEAKTRRRAYRPSDIFFGGQP